MTLDTRVYLHGEIDAHDVFTEVRRLLGANDSHVFTDAPSYREDGSWCLSNEPGQGLSAWLMVFYRPGGALRADGDACSDDPAMWCEVSLDTTYGYSDDQGRGCGDLHACYLAELGRWLDNQGVVWSWRNEFTGEIHAGDERYARLPDLTSGGAEASTWFTSTVLPAISTLTATDSDV